jgi:hypothetical protein
LGSGAPEAYATGEMHSTGTQGALLFPPYPTTPLSPEGQVLLHVRWLLLYAERPR